MSRTREVWRYESPYRYAENQMIISYTETLVDYACGRCGKWWSVWQREPEAVPQPCRFCGAPWEKKP